MNEQELAVMQLVREQNDEKRRWEQYEADCKRVVGGFLSASDVCRLFMEEGDDWHETPGAEARRLIAEKSLPFLEVGPGKFSVGHSITLPKEAS